MADKTPFELDEEDEKALAAMQEEPETTEADDPPSEQEEVQEPEAEIQAEAEKKPSMVPHQALHEERERRKAVEADNRRLAEERARFDERLRVIQEMRSQPQQVEQPPDPNEDPMGALNWMIQNQRRQQEETAQQAQQRQQYEAQQREWQQAFGETAREWQQAISEDPTLNDAYAHVAQSRAKELQSFGLQPMQIKAQLEQEEAQAIMYARQSGLAFADIIRSYAEARGFKAPADTKAADTVERISAAQTRGKSLSQAGGTAAPSEMTAERLLAMSNEEFDAWTNKNPDKARKLMGA